MSFLAKLAERFKTTFSNGVYLFLLFLLTLLLCRFLLDHRMLEAGVDLESSFIRVVGLLVCWDQGLLLGRWLPDINFGYGYPLLNFYSPLFTYFCAAIGWVMRDPLWGLNLGIICAFFFSAAAMYYFSKETWGKEGGFLSAVAYLYVPYHIFDLYIRGACAEICVFIFIPFVAYALVRIYKRPSVRALLVAMLAMAGLILSHNLLMVVFLFVAALFALFLYFSGVGGRQRDGRALCLCALAFVGALLLTAFFWLPVAVEKQYVMLSRVLQGFSFQEELFSLKQLFWRAWQVYPHKSPMLSFQLGFYHLILAGVVLVFIGKIRAFRLAAARQIFFWLAVGCVCAYLMTVYALWFWEGFPLARYFQFPWRLFVILDLVLCFIMGGLAVIFNRRSRSAIVLIVAILLVMGHIGLCKPDPRPDRKYKDLAVTDWKAWIYSQHPQDVMEYLPVWVKRLSMVKPPALFQVVQGDGEIFSGKNIPAPRQELTVRSARGAGVLFHQYYFPGWKVYVDGKETSVSHENDFGLILFAVPPGEHRVVVVFEHSNVRIWAEVMSILGWVILFVMLVLSRRKDIPCALTEK